MFSIFFAMSGFLLMGTNAPEKATLSSGFYYENVPAIVGFSSGYYEDWDNPKGNEAARAECEQIMTEKRRLLVQKSVDIILDEEPCHAEYWYFDTENDSENNAVYHYLGRIYFMN